MIRYCTFLLVLLACLGSAPAHAAERILYWDKINPWEERKLRFILDETVEDYGPYELAPSVPMEEGRAEFNLAHDEGIHIINVPATRERSKTLLPINLPTSDTMLGYRVMYVLKENEHLFRDVWTLDDLVNLGFSYGSGEHWADTPILEANGLNVHTAAKAEQLLPMLQRHRFEAYPRGIDQALRDLAPRQARGDLLEVVVEPHLVLHYPFRVIYYVNRKNTALAERIKVGVERMVANGKWARYVQENELRVRHLVLGLHLSDRRIIRLRNPSIPPEVEALPPLFHIYDPGAE